jgi:uncharacterized phage infection (PIP) family protein YhgE
MKTIFITLFLAIFLVALALILLGIKALFIKGGEFPSGHVHDLPRRRRLAREKLLKNKKLK